MFQANSSLFRRFKVYALALLLSPAGQLFAQQPDSVNLSTPYFTIYTHLHNLQEESYHPEVAAFTISPEAEGDRQDLAVKLKQVLDGSGVMIDLDDIPREADHYDSATNRYRYYLTPEFPQLYVEKVGEKWFYSKSSVQRIPTWHQEVFPFGIDRLLNVLPKLGTKKILGLHIWQLIGILILVTAAFILHKLFSFLLERLIFQLLLRFGYKDLAHNVVMPIATPISFLVIFPLLILLVPVLQLPIVLNKYVIIILRAVWPIFAIIFFYRLVDILSLYFTRLAEHTESTLDDQLVPLLRKILKTFVIIVGGMFILDNLEFDITGLIAGISIGGLAFALAAQDTIKNFFGSLMIFIDRPFQMGDWITSGEVDGTVEEVGFRSTRIRTFRNSLMYIPNGIITNQAIDNHGLRIYRRFMTKIAVTYDTPPDLIDLFVEGLKRVVEEHPDTRKDYYQVHFNDMGASSLEILFYIFFDVPTWGDELKARHEILLSVMRLAEELGVNFAFPTQTLHVETFPEKIGNSPKYERDPERMRQILDKYFARSGNQSDK